MASLLKRFVRWLIHGDNPEIVLTPRDRINAARADLVHHIELLAHPARRSDRTSETDALRSDLELALEEIDREIEALGPE